MSHPSRYQYQTKSDLDKKLYIQDAVDLFVFAAYIRKAAPQNQPSSDLGLAWGDITSPIIQPPDPRGIQDESFGKLSFLYPGVYFVSIAGSFEHNEFNQGRKTYIRAYDYTNNIPTTGEFIIPTGRNQEATTINLSFLTEVTDVQVGEIAGFQIGNGDTYTSVVINSFSISIFNTGVWQLPLG